MYADHIGAFLELLRNRHPSARNPNFKFGISVERSSGLDTELGDVPKKNTVVGHLRPSNALFVDHDESVIGEGKHVTEDFESASDALAGHEHWLKLCLNFGDVYLGGIPEEVTKQSHR